MDLLKVGDSPHIRGNRTTRMLMLDVIIALLPALIWAVYTFGIRSLTITSLCIVSCVLFEFLYEKTVGRKNTLGDFSAVLSGILLAFTLPVTVPLYFCVIGAFFAIVIVKQLFGGLGKNFLNPALSARVFLFICFPKEMTAYVSPLTHPAPLHMTVDFTAETTLLTQLKNGTLPDDISFLDLFLGKQGGCIGEISAFLLILGGVYLIVRRVISPILPLSYIATVGVVTFFFPQIESAVAWEFMMAELLSGGLVLLAFFMCTDYTTSPCTTKGRLIYGVGCGLLTILFRYYGEHAEGVHFAVLIMNLFVYYLDRYGKPVRFGGDVREQK